MKRLTICILFSITQIYSNGQNIAMSQNSGQKDTRLSPLADNKAIISDDHVRFTILTSGMIRMEWSESASFVDNRSFVIINRRLPLVPYIAEKKEGWLRIKTPELELKYKLGEGKFNAGNLSVRYLDPLHTFLWQPGMQQTGNLKGTYRTLDGFEGDLHADGTTPLKMEDGLLATDGWTLIDDSKSFLFDNSEWPWVKTRPTGEYQDWYFMGYGKQYKKALFDFSSVAGKVPLPPLYAFGYWWSRYWSYSDNDAREVVGNFEKYNVPLDVLVIDMDWHYTDSLRGKRDIFGESQQWTGWTWNKRLFPDPDNFLNWLKGRHLKTTLNLHPASGIAPYEAPYAEFARKMNFDTAGKRNIPYAGSDKKFMQTLFDVVLHPMEKKGVDFWWLDWQQWLNDKKIPGLSNTWWINYVFFSEKERHSSQRPLLYHRWGGLGNHRYQIGFSGDAIISWKTLAFQPYFTSSASNVLYGYWSHDIGGHMFKPNSPQVLDAELYTRWMQFGALSPIFRTHSTKNAVLNKEIWNFRGEFYDALNAAIRFRYQLAPYVYTMARKTYDSGICLVRPLYYDHPESPEAYDHKTQYMFGDDMMVAPVVAPMKDGESKLNVWLPPGNDWFEWNTGSLLKGGQTTERSFTLEEYPLYVKAGAVIPLYREIKNLDKAPEQTIIGVFPGADGSTRIYEDGGNSARYAEDFAFTKVVSRHLPGREQQISILPRKGKYQEMPEKRAYLVKLYGSELPVFVMVNGKTIPYNVNPDGGEWSYEGKELTVTIPLPANSCSVRQDILIGFSRTDSADVNTGMVKIFRQLTKAIKALKFRDAGIILPEEVGYCEETNLRLQYYPSAFYETLRYFNIHYPGIPDAIRKSSGPANADWISEFLKMK